LDGSLTVLKCLNQHKPTQPVSGSNTYYKSSEPLKTLIVLCTLVVLTNKLFKIGKIDGYQHTRKGYERCSKHRQSYLYSLKGFIAFSFITGIGYELTRETN